MRLNFPEFVDNPKYLDHWYSGAYRANISAVLPVVEVEGLDISFKRASRPNGSDDPSWDFGEESDYRKRAELL